MKRLITGLLGRVRPIRLRADAARPTDPAGRVLSQFLAWRLRVLSLVIVLTGLTAAIDTAAWFFETPRGPFGIELNLDREAEPVRQSRLGDLLDLIWLLSLYAMPASCLLAASFWSRPRVSRSILIAGWAASFLVPVAIALMPWSWWDAIPAARTAGRLERIQERIAWGLYYFAVLSPAVMALVPGVMRACIRVKLLVPGATLPGWILLAAAPFNGLLALSAFVSLAQVAPAPLLLVGMLLWLAAPMTYLIRSGVFIRPISTSEELRAARRTRDLARLLALGSVGCLVTYAVNWQAFGFRLIGFDATTSLLRPWQLIRYLLDFSGRALFVNVLGADILLRATLTAWCHQRTFSASPAAADFDQQMERLVTAGLARRD